MPIIVYDQKLDQLAESIRQKGGDTSLVDAVLQLYQVLNNQGLDESNIAVKSIGADLLKTQQAWIDISEFLNSWINYGALYANASYMKDSFGFVHLRGLIKNGTVAAPAFTLPVGYRPAYQMDFTVVSHNAFGSMWISTAGVVTPQVGDNLWFSLENIIFKAA